MMCQLVKSSQGGKVLFLFMLAYFYDVMKRDKISSQLCDKGVFIIYRGEGREKYRWVM